MSAVAKVRSGTGNAVTRVRSTASAAWDAAPRLKIAPTAQLETPKAPFMLAIIAVVSLGLVGLIVFSTVLQKQAFVIADLDAQITDLSNQRQAMDRELERLASPAGLGEAALELGMVPNANPVFIRLEDGKIIGKPTPAEPRTNLKRVNR